jgi:hypothetical protein
MFDLEDFILCVEALLIGAESVQKLCHPPLSRNAQDRSPNVDTPFSPATSAHWQTDFHGGLYSSLKGIAKTEPLASVVEYIDIIFRHHYSKLDADVVDVPRVSMQVGALFTACENSQSKATYTLSAPLSKDVVVSHFESLSIDMTHGEIENLDLAKRFVRALKDFRRGRQQKPNSVDLYYKDFEESSMLSFAEATHEELTGPFASTILLGRAKASASTTASSSDEAINELRRSAQTRLAKASPARKLTSTVSQFSPPTKVEVKSKGVKAKPGKNYYQPRRKKPGKPTIG